MKQKTHYAFAMGVSAFVTQSFVKEPMEAFVWLCLSPVFAYVSLLPDVLDKYPCGTIRSGVVLNHCRHHTTHHPLTIFYFIFFLFIPWQFTSISDILFLQTTTAWGSHLLLDALNPSGIPIGFSSIFNDKPSKHYAWKQYNREARRWRFAKINYDSPRANRTLAMCGYGFFVLSLVFSFQDALPNMVVFLEGAL